MKRMETFIEFGGKALLMGIVSLLKETLLGGFFHEKKVSIEAKCPKCGAKVNTTMERCPSCGTHISSMFRLECPECHESNEVSATACKKCGKRFVPEGGEGGGRETIYTCPRCGYRANFMMLSCPSCGVKFV